MSWNKLRKNIHLTDEMREFYNYQLQNYYKYITVILFVFGLFNLLLLIPDLLIVSPVFNKQIIFLCRTVLSGMFFFLSGKIRKVSDIIILYRIETIFEALSVLEFLVVLSLYDRPDFLIQTLGMVIIDIAVFLVPNRLLNMLLTSILGTSSFLVYSYLSVKIPENHEFLAGAVYLYLVIFLCSLFAIEILKYQYNEFVSKKQLIQAGSTDPLTQAWNRKKLYDVFDTLKGAEPRCQMPISLALLDIDKFKAVNDKYGHSAADSVLIGMVRLICSRLRSGDTLIRWGGDEFILLFPNTGLNDAAFIVENLREAIESGSFENSLRITCSFGLTEQSQNYDLDAMIRKADGLMYRAKGLGGNHVAFDGGRKD